MADDLYFHQKRCVSNIITTYAPKVPTISVLGTAKHPTRFYCVGERGSGFVTSTGRPQVYADIVLKCLASKRLFEDREFPCIDKSVLGSESGKCKIQWYRPHELVPNPLFFSEGPSRFDVVQGTNLYDCWLVVAAANLTLHDELFDRVVPRYQSFDKNYCGVFHFRFWLNCRWVDVVIDDRLPTLNKQLISMKSSTPNEFWSALFEKAFAKMHGSYAALNGGFACEAVQDLTGGICELVYLKPTPSKTILKDLKKAFDRKSLMAANIQGTAVEKRLPNGLYVLHAYSITDIREVFIDHHKANITLIRLRNPWGKGEWNGAWSDGSKEWSALSTEQRKKLNIVFAEDGEFWMSEKDFVENFSQVEACHVCLDFGDGKKWHESSIENRWVDGTTAGGSLKYPTSFYKNPQVVLKMAEPDEGEDICTIVIALMQKNMRFLRKNLLTIGLYVYKLDIERDQLTGRLPAEFFKSRSPVSQKDFMNSREICLRCQVAPGTYCIIPATEKPNQSGEFLLRVYAEKLNRMNDGDTKACLEEPSCDVEPAIEDALNMNNFRKVISTIPDKEIAINCHDLQRFFSATFRNELQNNVFTLAACRSMIALMHESDYTGTLEEYEMNNIWRLMRILKNAFNKFAKTPGSISTTDLQEALRTAGYTTNTRILSTLVVRYGENHVIKFDDFILCAIRLRCMMEIFTNKPEESDGTVKFTLDEWLTQTMSC